MAVDHLIPTDYRKLVLTATQYKDLMMNYLTEDLERRDKLLFIMVHHEKSLTEIINSEDKNLEDAQFCIKQLVSNISNLYVLSEVQDMDRKYQKGEIEY